MMKIFCMLILLFSVQSFALTKAEIKQSLEQMKASGMFTQEQLDAAEKELNAMDQSQIDSLVKKGQEKAQDPEFQKKAQEIVNNPEFKKKAQEALKQHNKTQNSN